MNSKIARPLFGRLRWFAGIVLSASMLATASLAADPAPPIPFAPVVQYFAKVTGVRPLRVHKQCIVFGLSEPISANDHHETLIVVTADPNRLAVSFLVSGEFGMNFIREFFESPFFSASETEAFYGLLGTRTGSATFHATNFSVEFTQAFTAEWMFLSLSFGPRSKDAPTPTPFLPLPQP